MNPGTRSSRTIATAIALFLLFPAAVTEASAASCTSGPAYAAGVTAPQDAIPGWPDRRATTTEINDYVRQMGRESDRVVTGRFATSWNGTPLLYALATSESHLSHLNRVVRREKALADPRVTGQAAARKIAARNPAIVWYTANVHGNEPSGGDAALQILYDLAARTDCKARRIRRNLVVGVIPTQNPDGRDDFARTNSYGFDMNRDWFARTQPETDGKLALLSRYPPVLYVDAHEQLGSDFFFPPNADPIYHEISSQSIHWINDIYGPALAKAFDRRRQQDPANWDYFNYDVYDLFYMGYGDTVPTTAFTAAGMTFEKGAVDSDRQRETEQYVAGWTTITQAATQKANILRQYYQAHRTALAEGRHGRLEPNRVFETDNELQRKVPALRVRNYFVVPDRAFPDVSTLIDRLIGMDVEVYQLRRPLRVPDFRPYGREARQTTLPRGTYWIPMAQPQKRWIQAMLGQDTYVPFPYFYDVTAWSNPLLMNLHAGFSGASVHPSAARVRHGPGGRVIGWDRRPLQFFWWPGDSGRDVALALALARKGRHVARLQRPVRRSEARIPKGAFVVKANGAFAYLQTFGGRFHVRVRGAGRPMPGGLPIRQPKIAVYQPPGGQSELDPTRSFGLAESYHHLRFVLDRVWRVPWTPVTGAEVGAGELSVGGYDVLVVPGVDTSDLESAREQIRQWIESGGTYVGTARPGGTGGTPYAVSSGYTSSQLSQPGSLEIPGTMFRVRLYRGSPVTLGAPRFAYWYNLGEDVLSRSTTGLNAGIYPKHRPDFWYSGYAAGAKMLRRSAGLVDEKLGDGHVVLFSGEPNYRAYTEGTAFLLANALIYPRLPSTAPTDVRSAQARDAVLAAMRSAPAATGLGAAIRFVVSASQGKRALDIIRRFTASVTLTVNGQVAVLRIPNPRGLDAEEHPFAWKILPALRMAGVRVRSAML